jgi:hypothetical protein
MNDPNPSQIIVGPASTGKTLLIQLKVLEILETEEDSKVLVLVPLEKMKKVYLKLFDQDEESPGIDYRYFIISLLILFLFFTQANSFIPSNKF